MPDTVYEPRYVLRLLRVRGDLPDGSDRDGARRAGVLISCDRRGAVLSLLPMHSGLRF